MPAFSRGCSRILSQPFHIPNYPLHSHPALFNTTRTPSFASSFTTSSIRNASKKAPTVKVTKPKTPFTSKPPFPKANPISTIGTNAIGSQKPKQAPNLSYIDYLASRKTSTTLYTSPSQFLYRTLSYVGAVFCFGYSLNAWDAVLINAPTDLHWVITYSYVGICVFMVSVGVWFLLGPNRMVREIIAVPQALSRTNSGIPGPLMIEVHLKTLVPDFVGNVLRPITPKFLGRALPQSIITVQPSTITLAERVTPHFINEKAPLQTAVEILAAQKTAAREKAIQAAIEAERNLKWNTHILSRGLQKVKQHGGYLGRKVWSLSRRMLTREGLVTMQIVGNRDVKLDVGAAWAAMDGGKASLDRLCDIKKGPTNMLLKA